MIQLETALCYQYCFCNTELKTATETNKGLCFRQQLYTFVLFYIIKLTLDERKTLTKNWHNLSQQFPSTSARFGQDKIRNKKTSKKNCAQLEEKPVCAPCTPVQTGIQRVSEKHPDFEIEPVNTIRPPEIKYTQMPQALVPIDTPLSIIRKHIPRQSDIDKIVMNIETHVIHSLELPIQAQDLIKAYQHSPIFTTFINT